MFVFLYPRSYFDSVWIFYSRSSKIEMLHSRLNSVLIWKCYLVQNVLSQFHENIIQNWANETKPSYQKLEMLIILNWSVVFLWSYTVADLEVSTAKRWSVLSINKISTKLSIINTPHCCVDLVFCFYTRACLYIIWISNSEYN